MTDAPSQQDLARFNSELRAIERDLARRARARKLKFPKIFPKRTVILVITYALLGATTTAFCLGFSVAGFLLGLGLIGYIGWQMNKDAL